MTTCKHCGEEIYHENDGGKWVHILTEEIWCDTNEANCATPSTEPAEKQDGGGGEVSTYSGHSNKQLFDALTASQREIQELRAKNVELAVELEKTKADRNRVGVIERQKYLPKIQELEAQCGALHSSLSEVLDHRKTIHHYPGDMLERAHNALKPSAGQELLEKLEGAKIALQGIAATRGAVCSHSDIAQTALAKLEVGK